MSRIIPHENNGRMWLLVEVPKELCDISIRGNRAGLSFLGGAMTIFVDLPPGEYSQPVMAGAMMESDWDIIVYKVYDYNDMSNPIFVGYQDHEESWTCGGFAHASDSGNSLLMSHSLTTATCVVVEKLK